MVKCRSRFRIRSRLCFCSVFSFQLCFLPVHICASWHSSILRRHGRNSKVSRVGWCRGFSIWRKLLATYVLHQRAIARSKSAAAPGIPFRWPKPNRSWRSFPTVPLHSQVGHHVLTTVRRSRSSENPCIHSVTDQRHLEVKYVNI